MERSARRLVESEGETPRRLLWGGGFTLSSLSPGVGAEWPMRRSEYNQTVNAPTFLRVSAYTHPRSYVFPSFLPASSSPVVPGREFARHSRRPLQHV